MNGWSGQVPILDLGNRAIERWNPPQRIYHTYYGGATLAARLLLEHIPARAGALAPSNAVFLGVGPLTGTSYPGAGRTTICAKSPLTGAWGESSVGGYFGRALKHGGLDGMVIKGEADEPIYIMVDDGGLNILPARDLWGADTYASEGTLRERHGKRCEVLTIGPAGERGVRIASIVHRRGECVAGRCGLGAVLGAKNVKAIVAAGNQQISIAYPERFDALRRKTIHEIRTWEFAPVLHDLGTGAMMDAFLNNGRTPTKNWQGVPWPAGQGKIGADVIRDSLRVGRAGCYGCPLACRKVIEIDEGPHAVGRTSGPEYETLAAMGAMLLIDDLAAICKANELANRLGVDTISAGTAIAWAMEAYEKGLITGEDTGGLRVTWGNAEALIRLTDQIGRAEGFGALLGQGSRGAARQVGGDSDSFAMQVKGLAIGMHNPRISRGQELSYATSPRGASHCDGGSVPPRQDVSMRDWVQDVSQSINRAGVPNTLSLCMFLDMAYSRELLSDSLEAVTGVPITAEGLEQVGERAWYLKRLFNLKQGIGPEEDRLPARIKAQVAVCDDIGSDTDAAMAELYRVRELDERGWPSKAKLHELGLEEAATLCTV